MAVLELRRARADAHVVRNGLHDEGIAGDGDIFPDDGLATEDGCPRVDRDIVTDRRMTLGDRKSVV